MIMMREDKLMKSNFNTQYAREHLAPVLQYRIGRLWWLSQNSGTSDHYDLAEQVEGLGLCVRPDSENNQLSEIYAHIDSETIIGQIQGDTEAKIVIDETEWWD